MKTPITVILTAIGCTLLFTACDSKEEQRREEALERKADGLENHADKVREGAEAKADALEDQAKQTRKAGEAVGDAVDKAAEGVREQK